MGKGQGRRASVLSAPRNGCCFPLGGAQVREEGRGLVVALNKCDALPGDAVQRTEKRVAAQLAHSLPEVRAQPRCLEHGLHAPTYADTRVPAVWRSALHLDLGQDGPEHPAPAA